MRYQRTFPALELPLLQLEDDILAFAKRDGVAKIDLCDTPLSNSEYTTFMRRFGTLMHEDDPAIRDFIEDEVILNIRTRYEECLANAHQPFATNGLAFHMERAFAPAEKQPNFLALLCIEPPDESVGGQTLAYAMDRFRTHFSDNELETMRRLYPQSVSLGISSVNPILARDERRDLEYFAFRDLGEFGTDWDVGPTPSDAVVQLMQKIRRCLYDHDNIRSLAWEVGRLYILDNKRVFHARTEQQHLTRRHLKRIRVL